MYLRFFCSANFGRSLSIIWQIFIFSFQKFIIWSSRRNEEKIRGKRVEDSWEMVRQLVKIRWEWWLSERTFFFSRVSYEGILFGHYSTAELPHFSYNWGLKVKLIISLIVGVKFKLRHRPAICEEWAIVDLTNKWRGRCATSCILDYRTYLFVYLISSFLGEIYCRWLIEFLSHQYSKNVLQPWW